MAGRRRRRPNGRRDTDAPSRVRPAEARDLQTVHAIESASFADPWSFHDFAETLAIGVLFLVAVAEDERVAGYLVARQVVDEGEILNVGVDPKHRRQGIGRALVREGLKHLHGRGAAQVYLEVRESNVAAIALYREFAFAEVGRRARYYRRPVEDAILLRAAIPAEGAPR